MPAGVEHRCAASCRISPRRQQVSRFLPRGGSTSRSGIPARPRRRCLLRSAFIAPASAVHFCPRVFPRFGKVGRIRPQGLFSSDGCMIAHTGRPVIKLMVYISLPAKKNCAPQALLALGALDEQRFLALRRSPSAAVMRVLSFLRVHRRTVPCGLRSRQRPVWRNMMALVRDAGCVSSPGHVGRSGVCRS